MFPTTEHPPALRHFEILECIGSGGVGQVYLAKSRAGRLVAIKVLSDTAEKDTAFSAALANEASLCARLSHPAIVQVRAFVEDAGFAALVFEYVQGVALGRLLRHLRASNARLPDRACWYVVERVLAALGHAHAQEPAPIVHRDVSPSNVLVDWTGDVKLTDFGMAKMIGVSPSTRLGLVKGTLGCMAPEQARGDIVTERADVYAAALLAWRLATGLSPFEAVESDELELLRAMRYPSLTPLATMRSDLPFDLLDGVTRALEPDSRRRTITAEELRRIVTQHVDVEAGRAELVVVLREARAALEGAVARGEVDVVREISSSRRAAKGTVRYEEVALAFDDAAADIRAPASSRALHRPATSPRALAPITLEAAQVASARIEAAPTIVDLEPPRAPADPTIPDARPPSFAGADERATTPLDARAAVAASAFIAPARDVVSAGATDAAPDLRDVPRLGSEPPPVSIIENTAIVRRRRERRSGLLVFGIVAVAVAIVASLALLAWRGNS